MKKQLCIVDNSPARKGGVGPVDIQEPRPPGRDYRPSGAIGQLRNADLFLRKSQVPQWRRKARMARRDEPVVDKNPAVTSIESAIAWPAKYDLFGVKVSATTYEEAVRVIVESARRRAPAVVSLHAVHALVTASRDPALQRQVNTFKMIGPDGQPVRWAINLLHGAGLRQRVYGPELMLRLCRRAAERGVAIYLYGSTPEVLDKLCSNLKAMFPELIIAGAESPPFRSLTAEEQDEMVRRVNQSGAGIMFVGLGAPKQDRFAYEHRHRIRSVQVCVGAAFDFHAGMLKMAPQWMRRHGLEWLFRLVMEPGRLWRRYLVTNSIFLVKLLVSFLPPRRSAAAEGRGSRSTNSGGTFR